MTEYEIDPSNVVVETMNDLADARALTYEESFELFKDFFRPLIDAVVEELNKRADK